LQASANNLSLRTATLRREDGTVTINGTVGLSSWALYPDSPLRAHVSMHNANAEELGSFAGYDHELTGKLSGEVQLTGTRRQPQGQGNVTLLNPVIRNVPFDSGSSSFALNGNQLAIRELRLERGGAQMTGTGAYDLGSKSFHMNMRGSGFDLAWFAPLERLPVKLAGKMDLTAEASGTASAPEITADLRLRNLSLDGEPQGDFLLSVRSNSDVAHVTGHSEFKNSELQLDGEVRLREQWPSHINLHLLRVDLDPLLAVYARSQAIHNSTASGDVVLDGPLRDPAGLNLSGALNDLEANAGSTNVHNDGPIRFALSGGTLKVDPFKLAGDNATFSGNGFVQLKGERNVDFQGEGKIGLQLLQAYDPDISSSGAVSGELQVTGTLDAPLLRGSVQIQDGAISDINVPSALSDINGKLVLNQNQVTIENLDAHVGGGTISFTGQANLSGKQLNFDVDANAGSVRLRYPPGVSSTANASLHWTGSSSGSVLSGDILVTKLGFTPGFDFGAYLERAAAVSSLPQTDPLLNRIRLDLHLTTTPELQMQTSVIRLQGSADLRVRGSAAKPIMLGRADVFEGEAYFNGTKYRLERGGVTFSNAAVTTPFVDLEAVTRVRDYDVTLSLNGDISRPNGLKVNYRSDPPLPSADIIALLAFGQTTQESAELQQTNQSAFSQQASNAMLAAALNATLSNRAQRLFGNSRIKIDPQGLESETSTTTQYGPAVTIEQQVKSNITLSYTTDVSQTAQQVIRAEYNISKNVSIVAIRDQNGVVSFDVKIRRRKR
jgi:translocation and assembly module TamB